MWVCLGFTGVGGGGGRRAAAAPGMRVASGPGTRRLPGRTFEQSGEQKGRGKNRQDKKNPSTTANPNTPNPPKQRQKGKKEEENRHSPPFLASHFAVQYDSISLGRPVPGKGRCCISGVSGEVCPRVIWGFVSGFYALLRGSRLPGWSSLNPLAGRSGEALPTLDLGWGEGEERKG